MSLSPIAITPLRGSRTRYKPSRSKHNGSGGNINDRTPGTRQEEEGRQAQPEQHQEHRGSKRRIHRATHHMPANQDRVTTAPRGPEHHRKR